MKITYDPITKEVVSSRLGNYIDCPEGLEEAWAIWPNYAQTCKVTAIENNWAQLEPLSWSMSLEQLKENRKKEILTEMTLESDQIREIYPIFKNPAWGVLYEEANKVAAGLLDVADTVLLTKTAQNEGVDLATFQTSIISQIDGSRSALTAVTEKYLQKSELINNAVTHEDVINITWED